MEDLKKEGRVVDNSYPAILERFVHSGTNADTDILNKLLIEPFALPAIWFFLNYTSVTANQISILGLIGGLSGSFLFAYTQNLQWVAGGYLFSFFCDYIDGAISEGRGGGTYFGAVLDLVADRTVTLFAILSLSYYHQLHGDAASNCLLLVYVSIFYFNDILAYATLRAKVSYKRLPPPPIPEPRNRTWLGNFLRPRAWFPVLLTSQLLAIITYSFSSNFSIAYGIAIFCGLCEFILVGVKLARKYRVFPFLSRETPEKTVDGVQG